MALTDGVPTDHLAAPLGRVPRFVTDETLDEAKRRMRARRNRQATAQLARSVRDLLRDQRPVRPRLP